jgi:transposase InsO family protein
LAIWQDKVTRRISGWSIGETMTAELVISALEKAIKQDLVRAGAIIHSDRGSQYVSNGFRELLRKNCFRQSMSGKGNCYDNAQAESFFSKFKAESEAFSYIEGYYSQVRIHSSLGDKSPMEFEAELKTKNNGGNRIFL